MKPLQYGQSTHQPAMTAPQLPIYPPKSLNVFRVSRSLAPSWVTGAGHTAPTGPLTERQCCTSVWTHPRASKEGSRQLQIQPVNLLPGTLQEHQALHRRAAHTAHPSLGHWVSTGCTLSKTVLLDFILLKAAAVRGHNSRETCLAFSVRALHGISNVTQSLSPLAFHSFIYGLGQQWSKKFIKKRWLLGALCEMALGRSCCAPAPTGSLNQGMRPHHIVTHMGTFPDHVHVVEVLVPHQQSFIRPVGGNEGINGKVIVGAGGLHWSPLRPEWEAEGRVTATQMLSKLIQQQLGLFWSHICRE